MSTPEASTPLPPSGIESDPPSSAAEVKAEAPSEAAAALLPVEASSPAEGAGAPLGDGGAGAGDRPKPRPPRTQVDLAATTATLRAQFPNLFDGPPKPLKLRIQADIQQRAPGVFSRQALSAFLHRYTTGTPYLAAMAQASSRFDLDGQPCEPVSDEHRTAAAAEVQRRRERRKAQAQPGRDAPGTGQPPGPGHGAGAPAGRPERSPRPPREAAPMQPPRPARPQGAQDPRGRGAPPRPEAPAAAAPAMRSPEDEARRERLALARDYQATTLTKANFCALKRITPDALDAALAAVAEDRARWARELAAREQAAREQAARRQASAAGSPEAAAGPGGAAPPQPAHGPHDDDGLTVQLKVSASANALFDAWTDPARFALGFDPSGRPLEVQGEAAGETGRWQFSMHDPDGQTQPRALTWVKLQRPHRLLYDYGDDPAKPWFRVGVTLRPQGEHTLLRLRLRWPDAAARQAALAQADMATSSLRLLERMAHVARSSAGSDAGADQAASGPSGRAAGTTSGTTSGKTSSKTSGKTTPEADRPPREKKGDQPDGQRAHATEDDALAPPQADDRVVGAQALQDWVAQVVRAAGSAEAEAEAVAGSLVGANLTGHDSHGVGMLPRYVDNLLAGGLRANQSLRVVHDQGALLTLDGQAGYGQVMARDAMQLAIARARQHGVAVVGLANAHHIGRVGQWAEQCVAAGLVSVHFVNVISEPIVAPFHGSDGRFVTNPLCVGIPVAGAEPVILDFATSRIAMGKVRVAHHRGRRVGPGTLIDAAGKPTRDPAVMFGEPRGALLPFGDHKGYGLALVCEILGGALAGGLTLHEQPSPHSIINNMLSFVVDPERLGTAATLAREARAFVDWVQASPPLPGRRVMLPGQPERERHARRSRDGIPIDPTTWTQLLEAAERVGVQREVSLRQLGQADHEPTAQPAEGTPAEPLAPPTADAPGQTPSQPPDASVAGPAANGPDAP